MLHTQPIEERMGSAPVKLPDKIINQLKQQGKSDAEITVNQSEALYTNSEIVGNNTFARLALYFGNQMKGIDISEAGLVTNKNPLSFFGDLGPDGTTGKTSDKKTYDMISSPIEYRCTYDLFVKQNYEQVVKDLLLHMAQSPYKQKISQEKINDVVKLAEANGIELNLDAIKADYSEKIAATLTKVIKDSVISYEGNVIPERIVIDYIQPALIKYYQNPINDNRRAINYAAKDAHKKMYRDPEISIAYQWNAIIKDVVGKVNGNLKTNLLHLGRGSEFSIQ